MVNKNNSESAKHIKKQRKIVKISTKTNNWDITLIALQVYVTSTTPPFFSINIARITMRVISPTQNTAAYESKTIITLF